MIGRDRTRVLVGWLIAMLVLAVCAPCLARPRSLAMIDEASTDGGIGQGPATSAPQPVPRASDEARYHPDLQPAVPRDDEIPPAAEMGPPSDVEVSSPAEEPSEAPQSDQRMQDAGGDGFDRPVSAPYYVPYPVSVPVTVCAPNRRRNPRPVAPPTPTPTVSPVVTQGQPLPTTGRSGTYPSTKPWGSYRSTGGGSYPMTKPTAPTYSPTKPTVTTRPSPPSYAPRPSSPAPPRVSPPSPPPRPSYSGSPSHSVVSPAPRTQSAPTKPARSSGRSTRK